MAAVIQFLQLNFECAASVSSTSTANHKELSWHNQVDWNWLPFWYQCPSVTHPPEMSLLAEIYTNYTFSMK